MGQRIVSIGIKAEVLLSRPGSVTRLVQSYKELTSTRCKMGNAKSSKSIYGRIDKWSKSPPFHGGIVGSNPAAVTISARMART